MEDRTTMICPHWKEPCTDGRCPSFKKFANKATGHIPRCRFWVVVAGKKADGTLVDTGDCSEPWNVTIGTELATLQFSTGAAVESLRNRVKEVVSEISQAKQIMAEKPVIMLAAPDAQSQLPPPNGETKADGNS